MSGLTELAGADDSLDERPHLGSDRCQHGVVELGMRRQVPVQQLLANAGTRVTTPSRELDRGQFAGQFLRRSGSPTIRDVLASVVVVADASR